MRIGGVFSKRANGIGHFSELVRALAIETHEEWLEGNRYLNMALLKEYSKQTGPGGLNGREPHGPPPTSHLETHSRRHLRGSLLSLRHLKNRSCML